MPQITSCQSSLDAAEPLIATATEARIWICLEYRGTWQAKAFGASQLPSGIKSPLRAALDDAPDSRLQFIRKPGRTRGPLALFLARVDPRQPQLFRLEFTAYQDLKGLDFKALVAATPPPHAVSIEHSLVLVCGNGRRDVCCARHGTAVYRELAHHKDADIWLSDHQGGHRFAANTVVLPHGIQFGRLRPDTALGPIKACLEGSWDMVHTRGRVSYSRPAQAAEHFLRQRTGELGRDAFRLVSAEPLTADRWRVQFEEAATGRVHTVDVAITPSSFDVIKTTGDSEPAKVPQYKPA
jgi:hypothetical protein